MAIIINNKVLFIHFLKTGGSFVGSFFNNYCEVENVGNQHDPVNMINREEKNKMFKCSIIRHPVSWWQSYWNWKNKDWENPEGGPGYRFIPTWHLFKYASENIDDFIENVYKKEPEFLWKAWQKYIQGLDKVYLYEDFASTIQDIGKTAGIYITREEINNFGRVHASNYFETIQKESTKQLILKQENEIMRRYYRESQTG